MFDFWKLTKTASEDSAVNAPKTAGTENSRPSENVSIPETEDRALTIDDEDLAVPEIHVKRFAKDMEYVKEILEEESHEAEPFVETENLAFPEIHFSKLKKKKI